MEKDMVVKKLFRGVDFRARQIEKFVERIHPEADEPLDDSIECLQALHFCVGVQSLKKTLSEHICQLGHDR